jgi:hypothetical protein
VFAHLRILRRVVVRYVTAACTSSGSAADFLLRLLNSTARKRPPTPRLQRFFCHLIDHVRLSALAAPDQEPRSAFIYYTNKAILWNA